MGPSRSSSPPVVFSFRNNGHHMAIISAGPPLNHLDETHSKGCERTGTPSFTPRAGRLPPLHRRGPLKIRTRALATKSRMGRQVVGTESGTRLVLTAIR